MAYEHIHIKPDGSSGLEEFIEAARICGYTGLVIRNHHDSLVEAMDESDPDSSLDVHWGVEVHTDDVDVMHGLASKYKDMDRHPVYLHGGSKKMNQAGITSPRIDVLSHPLRKGMSGFDHVLAEKAAETGTVIEMNLSGMISSNGGDRIAAIRGLGLLLDLQRKYGYRYILTTDAIDHRQIRSRRGITALCELLGFTDNEVTRGLHGTASEILNR